MLQNHSLWIEPNPRNTIFLAAPEWPCRVLIVLIFTLHIQYPSMTMALTLLLNLCFSPSLSRLNHGVSHETCVGGGRGMRRLDGRRSRQGGAGAGASQHVLVSHLFGVTRVTLTFQSLPPMSVRPSCMCGLGILVTTRRLGNITPALCNTVPLNHYSHSSSELRHLAPSLHSCDSSFFILYSL